MKTILALSILFCAIALPALGELTVQDLPKNPVQLQESEQELKEDISDSEIAERKSILISRSAVLRNNSHT